MEHQDLDRVLGNCSLGVSVYLSIKSVEDIPQKRSGGSIHRGAEQNLQPTEDRCHKKKKETIASIIICLRHAYTYANASTDKNYTVPSMVASSQDIVRLCYGLDIFLHLATLQNRKLSCHERFSRRYGMP